LLKVLWRANMKLLAILAAQFNFCCVYKVRGKQKKLINKKKKRNDNVKHISASTIEYI